MDDFDNFALASVVTAVTTLITALILGIYVSKALMVLLLGVMVGSIIPFIGLVVFAKQEEENPDG